MILSSLRKKIKVLWKVDHERTVKIRNNIIYSFILKCIGVLVGFILIPLTINYINPVQYGIWITIVSIVAWINTFDIGLSNGLRNKLAQSIAVNETQSSIKYVSTTYILLVIIAVVVFISFFVVGSFFNWNQLLNVNKAINYNIWPIIIIALGFFCIQFILQPIISILLAIQQPFKTSLIFLAGQLLTLILTYIITIYTHSSLFILVTVVTGSPVFVLLISSIYFFRTSLNDFTPNFQLIDFKSAKSLLNLGSFFFLIQIGSLILYETDNIIIARILGPARVTTFNIAYKYFSILTVVFYIVITPFWSAFTDAYAKTDFSWIKQSIKKIRIIWLCFSFFALIMYIFSAIFYTVWIGNKIVISSQLSLSMAIYTIVQNWLIIHSYMLNGIGKIRIQSILIFGTGILNIPLSILLVNYLGISGTVIANIIVMLIMSAFLNYQCKLVINEKALGIWSK